MKTLKQFFKGLFLLATLCGLWYLISLKRLLPTHSPADFSPPSAELSNLANSPSLSSLNQQLQILQWRHITWHDGLWAGGILLTAILFGRMLLGSVFAHLEQKMIRWQWMMNAAILRASEAPFSAFILLSGGYLASQQLAGDDYTLEFLNRFYCSSNLLLLIWLLMRWNDAFFDRISKRQHYPQSNYFGVLPVLKRSARWVIGLIGLLMVIDSLGYSVTGLFATLGIGGALIALSAKDTVANIFGSLCIVLDRPFRVGDWISNRDGSISGDVESIGLRSTKIRTATKSLMVVPNALLTNEVIDNWARMERRGSKQYFHLKSATATEKIDRLRSQIEHILRQIPEVESDTFFIVLAEFEERTLKFQLQYYTFALDSKSFMEVRDRVNRAVLRATQQLEIQLSVATEIQEKMEIPKNDLISQKMADS